MYFQQRHKNSYLRTQYADCVPGALWETLVDGESTIAHLQYFSTHHAYCWERVCSKHANSSRQENNTNIYLWWWAGADNRKGDT